MKSAIRKADKIEETHGRKLTNRQREFAKHYVDGTRSNAACARLAGYAESSARIQAHNLLDPTLFPHVTELITELREDRARRYGVTLQGQIKRFRELSGGAEKSEQYSAAIVAEKAISSLGGLTVDRRETSHFHAIEQMNGKEIEERLSVLRKQNPGAFIEAKYEVLEDIKPEVAVVEKHQEENTKKLAHNKGRKPL
ncbi:MAG: terminase small subunit [Chloroflexi bacterium]|nr:terminase small subunit [Chloroflexota bacterium]